MLSFFPSPYPDELWYSVLARYHTHSGALSWQATMAALFGDARDTDVGSFFPNNRYSQNPGTAAARFFACSRNRPATHPAPVSAAVSAR